MNNTGPIRRADLYLRTEYPEFITKIYRIEENKFLIYIENLGIDFNTVQENFNSKLKPITAPVKLSENRPKKYVEVVPCMLDTEISKGLEGILMSKPEFINLLAIKFPKINFYKITDDWEIINLHIAEYKVKEGNLTKIKFLDRFSRKALEDFITNYKSAIKFNIIIDKFDEKPVLTEGFSKDEKGSFIYVNSQSSKPKYVQRDESLWYDNVDGIFEGSFVKGNLFFYDNEEYSCYVDFSVFPNINLRYHLMLYEIVYLSPPLNEKMDDWLKTLSINRNEFIELVARKR